jgi:hypothetical protein
MRQINIALHMVYIKRNGEGTVYPDFYMLNVLEMSIRKCPEWSLTSRALLLEAEASVVGCTTVWDVEVIMQRIYENVHFHFSQKENLSYMVMSIRVSVQT